MIEPVKKVTLPLQSLKNIKTTGILITKPIDANEEEILALRGTPVPNSPGYYFHNQVYKEDGQYKIAIIKKKMND